MKIFLNSKNQEIKEKRFQFLKKKMEASTIINIRKKTKAKFKLKKRGMKLEESSKIF